MPSAGTGFLPSKASSFAALGPGIALLGTSISATRLGRGHVKGAVHLLVDEPPQLRRRRAWKTVQDFTLYRTGLLRGVAP